MSVHNSSKMDVHEAYQVLLKVIKAKNKFLMKTKANRKISSADNDNINFIEYNLYVFL